MGVFNKTIIPLALVGYEMSFGNSARGIRVKYNPYRYVCTAPKSMVFAPLRCEKGYRLCPFWSGIRYGFRGNYTGVYERIRRFNSKCISKGSVLYKFESVFKKPFCWRSNLSNDDIIS